MKTTDLKGLTLRELEDFTEAIGGERYRGRQIFDWLYRKGATSFSGMTSLSAALRERLDAQAGIGSLNLIGQQTSALDGTTKFLFGLADGSRIESVLIPPRKSFEDRAAGEEQQRLTVCISTQAGCPLDCAFCATATMGFLRNLTSGEIVDQVMAVRRASGKRITNIVYMGMGEPLMNYENVMKSVEILTTGLDFAARRITISTAGWAPNIIRMGEEKRRAKLAVSLHTLDDRVRTSLMPVNKKFNVGELLSAVERYYRSVKQRVTFEYILFDGMNDREEDILALVRLSRRIPCKINVIPFHPIDFAHPRGISLRLNAASPARIGDFVRRLREAHVTVFVRSSAGEDIEGACGQLAVKHARTGRPRPIRHSRHAEPA